MLTEKMQFTLVVDVQTTAMKYQLA